MEFNRFDVSTKELVWDDPIGWLERLGIEPHGAVEVIDSDITTLTTAADKVLSIGGDEPFLVHIEFQSGHESDLIRSLWFRQTALDYRHGKPVLTVLVLLRKAANSPAFTGAYERLLPDGRLTNLYNYRVVRLWREDVEPYLTGGIGLVPLAPLKDVTEEDLLYVVRRMAERINREPSFQAAKLWTATYLLMGLCYTEELVDQLLGGVHNMQESVTYQKILREGRQEGRQEGREQGRILDARQSVLRLGTKRFGEPNAATVDAVEAIQDIDRLHAIIDRSLDLSLRGWDDFLAES